MKNLIKKVANVFYMIMFCVSFIAFYVPYAMQLNDNFAFNLFAFGLLGTTVFFTAWVFSLDCWFENYK